MSQEIDHDQLFKQLLRTFFLDFLDLFAPEFSKYINRDTVEFLPQEYFTDLYDGMTSRILKKQNHKCAHCNLSFYSGDIAELHHVDGNHDNWKHSNLEVLHRECHQHQTIHGQVRVRTAG